MKFILITLLFLLPMNFDAIKFEKKVLHPVHISFTTIEYFEKEHQYKILFKIFADDFDLILNTLYNKNIQLAAGKWEKSYLEPINSYISNNFKLIDSNDKTLVLKFDRKEFKEKAVCLYYKVKRKAKKGKFRVLNKLILDLYPDQKNLLIFVFDGKTEAIQFGHNDIEKEVNF